VISEHSIYKTCRKLQVHFTVTIYYFPLADMNNHNSQQNCKMESISCCDYS